MMLRICYKSTISEGEVITGGSAFSVKAESLRLGDFTRGDVGTLLGQHTAETGQAFAPGGVEMVWTQTRGQPWLVNALARQLCFRRERPVVRDRPISERDAFEAREAPGHAHRAACRQAARTEGAGVVEPLLSGGDGAHSEADGDYVPAGAASSGSTRSGAGGWSCWSSGQRGMAARAGSWWSASWWGKGAPTRAQSRRGWCRPRPTWT